MAGRAVNHDGPQTGCGRGGQWFHGRPWDSSFKAELKRESKWEQRGNGKPAKWWETQLTQEAATGRCKSHWTSGPTRWKGERLKTPAFVGTGENRRPLVAGVLAVDGAFTALKEKNTNLDEWAANQTRCSFTRQCRKSRSPRAEHPRSRSAK